MTTKPEFDIVLWGGSSFVGKLAAKHLHQTALGIYLVGGAADLGLGATYFSSKQFMSYHAEAVGAPWQELDAGIRTLILALMKLAGGGWFALGVFTIVMAWAALRRRNVLARWILPAGTLIAWSASFAATWGVNQATGAATPWAPSLAMIAFALLAFIMDAPRDSNVPDENDVNRHAVGEHRTR